MYTNHPSVKVDQFAAEEFDRKTYRSVLWHHESRNTSDDIAMFGDVSVVSSGSFHFYFIDEDG